MFSKLVSWFSGRHTMFAFLELIFGTLLAKFGLLTMTYVALVGTIQSLVLAHSVKEDYFNANGTPAASITPLDSGNTK